MTQAIPGAELTARLKAMSRDDLEDMIHFLNGWDPSAVVMAVMYHDNLQEQAAATVARAIETGEPLVVEDDGQCPAVSPWGTHCTMTNAEHAADPRILHRDKYGDPWRDHDGPGTPADETASAGAA